MNLEAEERNGYFVSHQTKKVWDIQLKMVKKLLEVCKKHNLKVWADSGTLIGAVRHKGFIPWDDDIDMIMMRNDYNKLVALADEFEYPYFLQCAYTEKGYARGHIQIRYEGTAAVLPGDMDKPFDQSIFVDVFAYDAVPKDYNQRTKYAAKVERLRRWAWCALYPSFQIKDIKSFLVNCFLGVFKHVCNFYSVFEEYCSKYPIGDDSRIFPSSFTTSFIEDFAVTAAWYKETIYVPFEDMQMPIPKDYDKILTAQYGDYMTPVKAPSMHGCVVFDTERSYKDVIADIKSGKIDLKTLNE